jgi:catechol 2,3-dioxygenase-like lactoylglutathione lyase family enzyme
MTQPAVPLCATHNVRLPVSNLEQSFRWYAELLGYERDFDFKNDNGEIYAWALKHPNGGTRLVLMHDPERARAASGFPYFSFGVPDEATIRRLAACFDARGIRHGGVQAALVGFKLPFVQDPDGHLLGFYVIAEQPAYRS